jgi:hypothetical protein
LKGSIKRTAVQLVKEFSLPLVVSVAWTAYVIDEVTVQSIGANFGGAFFFVSWMTGQFFRVRKQAGVENSLSLVQDRIQLMTERLEHQTERLIGYVTGGDSFFYFRIIAHGDDSSTWLAVHGGGSEFPVYRAKATIVDLDIFDATVSHGRADEADTFVSVGDLLPRHSKIVLEHDLESGDSRSFNVFMTAGNGPVQQKIRLRRVGGIWAQATRVINDRGVVHVKVDDDYPRDATGEVCWD